MLVRRERSEDRAEVDKLITAAFSRSDEVAMAYEGLDAPEVAVVAALTHIRSRPWLEQMLARATRVDPRGGPYAEQRALVFHPDDPMFRRFRERIETEQGTLARAAPPRRGQGEFDVLRDLDDRGQPIVPLSSNATALRWAELAPGPDFAAARPERWAAARSGPLDVPSRRERELRQRIGRMVAAQAVEDQAALRFPRGAGGHHAYAAALKRALGGKARALRALGELEAAAAWLERNRISAHLHLLDGDPRFLWAERRRRMALHPPRGPATARRG